MNLNDFSMFKKTFTVSRIVRIPVCFHSQSVPHRENYSSTSRLKPILTRCPNVSSCLKFPTWRHLRIHIHQKSHFHADRLKLHLFSNVLTKSWREDWGLKKKWSSLKTSSVFPRCTTCCASPSHNLYCHLSILHAIYIWIDIFLYDCFLE